MGKLDVLRNAILDSAYSTDQLVDFAVKFGDFYISADGPADAKAVLTSMGEDTRLQAAHTLVSVGVTLDQLHKDTPELPE